MFISLKNEDTAGEMTQQVNVQMIIILITVTEIEGIITTIAIVIEENATETGG